MFQSTLPRRERPVVRNEIDKYKTFQSTLPRRERPAIIFGDTTAWNVSIHAPTKGATPNGTSANANADVSIHAPTKGATA